jgi:hypothetical protein
VLVAIDPLLSCVQQDAAYELATAATNMAVTVELLAAAHAVTVGTGDLAAGDLLAVIETMSTVRDSLHGHAATLANAARTPGQGVIGGPASPYAGRLCPAQQVTPGRQTLIDVSGGEQAASSLL